jgi:hypothetical protein
MHTKTNHGSSIELLPQPAEPSPDFFALFDDALEYHPFLLVEVGYNRQVDWMVHIWDGTGVGIKNAAKIMSIQESTREEAFAVAAQELIKRFPEIRPPANAHEADGMQYPL